MTRSFLNIEGLPTKKDLCSYCPHKVDLESTLNYWNTSKIKHVCHADRDFVCKGSTLDTEDL